MASTAGTGSSRASSCKPNTAAWNYRTHTDLLASQLLEITQHTLTCLRLQNTCWPACSTSASIYEKHADLLAPQLLEFTEHTLTCLPNSCLNLQNTHWPACLCSTSKYISGVTMLRGYLNAHHMTERAPTDFQKLRVILTVGTVIFIHSTA